MSSLVQTKQNALSPETFDQKKFGWKSVGSNKMQLVEAMFQLVWFGAILGTKNKHIDFVFGLV